MGKKLEDYKDGFRIFEIIEDTYVLDRCEGHKVLEKGHRFIGFYYDDSKYIWISNTDINLSAQYARELYKISFKEV